MSEWTTYICEYLQQYFANSPIVWMYMIGLVFLCFRGKEKRRMIVYPSILIMVVIINPVLYRYIWVKLIEYAYWRMLWMIPVIPVIACAVVELVALVKKTWFAPVMTVVCVGIMLFACENIYRDETVFTKEHNIYKLPDADVAVAKRILELTDEPFVLAPDPMYCHLRQCDGNIKLLYGRNSEGFVQVIQDEETWELVLLMWSKGGDAARLSELAQKKGVNIIVLPWDYGFGELEGYEYADYVQGNYLYKRIN